MDQTPVDYLSGLGGLGALPDSVRAQNDAIAEKLGLQRVAMQNQAGQIQLRGAQRQQKRDTQYDAEIEHYVANPTARGAASLITKYPEYAKQVQDGWSQIDKSRQSSDLQQMADVYGAASNGKADVAGRLLRTRIAADKASGQDTTHDEAIAEALESGDPEQVKSAVAQMGLGLAAITGPEKFASTYDKLNEGKAGYTLAPGSRRYDANGKMIAEAPFAPEYRNVGPGDSLVQVGGGDPASSAGGPVSGRTTGGWTPRARNGGDNPDDAVDNKIAGVAKALGVDPNADISSLSPAQIAKALAFGEGGTGTLADRNNNPTNMRNGDGTYKRFKSDDDAINAAAALVQRKLKNGQTSVRTMIEGLPVGGGQSAGGARVVAQGAPKPGYETLSAAEKTALGLPVHTIFQRSPDGKVEAVSGQDTKTQQAQAVPASAQKSILDNHSTLREVTRALEMVKKNPGSFGYGTGAFGSAFTNWNDPKGVGPRAAVGKFAGKIVHDVSGAAVSASESPRFAPYIPEIGKDSSETIIQKLTQFKALLESDQGDLVQAYGPENGYRGIKLPGQVAPVKVSTPADAVKLKPGTLYLRPDGKVMRR